MRQSNNIKAIAELKPDFMGFIMYRSSPRFVPESKLENLVHITNDQISKVAVFVNEKIDEVLRMCTKHGFEYVQLHGTESMETCNVLKANGVLS